MPPDPNPPPKFALGDRVVHANKPEWGSGAVSAASATTHEGTPCQRLTIRFDRAGLKTISTAFAPIELATKVAEALKPKIEAHHEPLPISSAGHRELLDIMTKIPDKARDPFATPAQRLEATLSLYRFEGTGGSLIDWAAAQSGLADPLSRFNRHELEDYYRMFEMNLRKHLSKVVSDANTVPSQELVRIAQSAPPQAQRALQRLHKPR
jgi:Protein of unknown function (DUF3553)